MDSVGGRAMIYLWISRSVSLSTFDINFISRHQQKEQREISFQQIAYAAVGEKGKCSIGKHKQLESTWKSIWRHV